MWKHVFSKELFEMLRDRRVVVGSFLMPALVILVMLRLIAAIESSVSESRTSVITVVAGTDQGLAAAMLKSQKIETVATLEEGQKQLKSGKAKLVVKFEPSGAGRMKAFAYFDSGEPLSQVLMGAFRQAIAQQNASSAKKVVEGAGLDPALLEPIQVEPKDVASQEAQGAAGLASLIPYVIILWAFYGGFASVSDMVAGEKERGTLETLLVSPASRTDILMGKALALSLICLASALFGLVGVAASALMGGEGRVSLGIEGLAVSLVALLPLVTMFAALLMLVSTYARNMREAQTYLSVASFIVLMPAIFSNMLGFTGLAQAVWIKFTPVLSASVAIRSAILGKPDWLAAIGSFSVNALLTAVLMFITWRMFHRETILARI